MPANNITGNKNIIRGAVNVQKINGDKSPLLAQSRPSSSAAQEIDHAYGKEKVGVVSASNAYTLDDLSFALSRKADE